jgi:hypothetical protein
MRGTVEKSRLAFMGGMMMRVAVGVADTETMLLSPTLTISCVVRTWLFALRKKSW